MSCLFDSLTKLLNEEFQGFYEDTKLRDIVCDFIRERPNDILNGCKVKDWIDIVTMDEFDSKISISEYIDKMREDSTWGGAPEMSIISKLFNVEIHVVQDGKVISKFACSDDKINSILTLEWNRSHYEPIDRINV